MLSYFWTQLAEIWKSIFKKIVRKRCSSFTITAEKGFVGDIKETWCHLILDVKQELPLLTVLPGEYS